MTDHEKRRSGGGPAPIESANETLSSDDLAASEATLSGSADGVSATDQRDRPRPAAITGYRIIRLLGEGGMGVVWEGEQQRPHRRVALKVMRRDHVVDELHSRLFFREAETLARLKHPNIAAIYESGHTDDGHDFFAMELVTGMTLDRWLQGRPAAIGSDELKLRLQLFGSLCDAVHYAHQRGVIHRDLKPSNIIVADDAGSSAGSAPSAAGPMVKILDFGLARITDADVAATLVSEIGVIKGTLQYMSPEQARGDVAAIDVRCDVYALGMILFELLAGQRPYDVSRSALAEAVRVICEERPRSLRQSWKGSVRLDADLETIVGKALEKEMDRRYDSAAALGDDVARYLSSRPIQARPPSAAYQMRKFASRNRALVGGAVTTLIVLIAGTVVSTTFGLREAAQRREAEQARAELEVVTDFQADMLAQIDPARVGAELAEDVLARFADALAEAGEPEPERTAQVAAFEGYWSRVNATDAARDLIDRTILKPAIRAIDERFKDQPLVEAQLRQTLANQYRELGLYQAALPLQTSALETRRRLLGDDHPGTLASINHMGTLLEAQGAYDEALPFYREVLETRRRTLGDDHPATLESINNMGLLLQGQGKLAEAESCFRKALEGTRRIYGDGHQQTMTNIGNLGLVLHRQGKLDEAEPYYREALEGNRRFLGDDHPDTLRSVTNMGMLLREQGKLDEAEVYLRQAVESRRRVMGEEHPMTLFAIANLAFMLEQAGRYAEAEPYCREALDGKRRILGDNHKDTLISIGNMAKLLIEVGKGEEAERLAREAVERGKATLGESHWFIGNFLGKHGLALASIGRYAEAEEALLEGYGILVASLGEDHEQTRRVMEYLADLYDARHAAEPTGGYASKAAEWRAK